MKNAAIIAGYWDRAANHNTEMQQYLAALEDMTGERHEDLRLQMRDVQRQISAERARWQARLPKGRG